MHENNHLHAHSALSRIRNYLGSHSLRYFAGAIAVIGRESGSGTRDGFESITGTEDQCVLAQELSSTGAVIEAVRTTPGAIGYMERAAVDGRFKIVFDFSSSPQ